MNREQIIERLRPVHALYQEAQKYYNTHGADDLLAVGLLSTDEAIEYASINRIEYEISHQISVAQDNIQRRTILDEAPEGYRELRKQMDVLKGNADKEKDTMSLLNNLNETNFYSKQSGLYVGLDAPVIKPLVRQIKDILRNMPNSASSQYSNMRKQLDRKERAGTIVARVRDRLKEENNNARIKITKDIQAESKKKYEKEFARKAELNQLIVQRRTEKIKHISNQIKTILEGIIKEGK